MKRLKLLLLILVLPLSLLPLKALESSARNRKQGRRVPLTVLQSSEKPLDPDSVKKSSLAQSRDGQKIYSLSSMSGELSVYERRRGDVKRMSAWLMNVQSFAVGSQDNLYFGTADSGVQISDSTGRRLRQFATVYPWSIAALGNGNVVVASPSGGKLLHLYSSTGLRLRSFGEMKSFDPSGAENEYLNRGKVVVGAADEIYFVSMYAPAPFALKFDSNGNLLAEFSIEGDAIDFQTNIQKSFLRERNPNLTGGFTIINSASVDPETGHLWVAMNGLSTTATVYEYDAAGTKLREYAFLINSTDWRRRNLTYPKDIVVGSSTLSILTWDGTYNFKLSDVAVADAWIAPVKATSTVKASWLARSNPFALIKKLWGSAPSASDKQPSPRHPLEPGDL